MSLVHIVSKLWTYLSDLLLKICWLPKFAEYSEDDLKIEDFTLKLMIGENEILLVVWLIQLIKFVWFEVRRSLKLKFVWRMISNTKREIVSANIIVSDIMRWEINASQTRKSKKSNSCSQSQGQCNELVDSVSQAYK